MTNLVFSPGFQQALIEEITSCMQLAVDMQQRLAEPDFIWKKEDHSPVTRADHHLQERLERFLANASPYVFVGEENAKDWLGKELPEKFWLCDPIDGTRDYVRGGRNFAINLALIENGAPVFGLIADPHGKRIALTTGYRETSFVTAQGKDVVSRTDPVLSHRLIVGHTGGKDADAFEAHFGFRPDQVIARPSALKFHSLLDNEADYYIRAGEVSEWDIAAGEALLRAAGGDLLAFDGETRIHYGQVQKTFLLKGLYATR